MKEIKLTRGKVALVDDEDFEELNEHSWHAMRAGRHWYAVRASRIDGKQHPIYMHRVIIDAQPGQDVDHVDMTGLHNYRANLRLCTDTQNQANRQKQAGCSSKYKGVTWHKQHSKWMAYIRVHGKRIYLGYFDDEWEAALAYNDAALKQWGEFARLNVIEEK